MKLWPRVWCLVFLTHGVYITFGGSSPSLARLTLDGTELKRVAKLKYLGWYFCERSSRIYFSYTEFRNFMAIFNSMLSVIGYNKNQMATLHLIKTFSVPSVLYGCETSTQMEMTTVD